MLNPMRLLRSLISILGVTGFIFGVLALNNLAEINVTVAVWIAIIVGAILWVCYFLLLIREQVREVNAKDNPVIWAITEDRNGVQRWSAMDGSGRTRPLENPPRETQSVFDQEEVH